MKSEKKIIPSVTCPIFRAQKIISGKWKIYLLYLLSQGTKRFSDLYRETPGITQAMLSKQLRELEAAGIISRYVYPEIPPKVEYSLTELGQNFMPVLDELAKWSCTHLHPEEGEEKISGSA
ncbi:helix-turn-helix domain-containing protein [Methanorbis rubei]|uniref:HTH-type transcriptional regulator YybR n=1 Tax=Methanorbis rubei TaxID=3028300 RepID=A0AAE4MDX5_9EURY|nr:putative HTH-type transcriptional regulator YybR [Methanocorpusculaceae archaeon Cs1]